MFFSSEHLYVFVIKVADAYQFYTFNSSTEKTQNRCDTASFPMFVLCILKMVSFSVRQHRSVHGLSLQWNAEVKKLSSISFEFEWKLQIQFLCLQHICQAISVSYTIGYSYWLNSLGSVGFRFIPSNPSQHGLTFILPLSSGFTLFLLNMIIWKSF